MPWVMVGIACATNNRNAPKSLDFGKPTKHFEFKNKLFIKELLTTKDFEVQKNSVDDIDIDKNWNLNSHI